MDSSPVWITTETVIAYSELLGSGLKLFRLDAAYGVKGHSAVVSLPPQATHQDAALLGFALSGHSLSMTEGDGSRVELVLAHPYLPNVVVQCDIDVAETLAKELKVAGDSHALVEQ